MSSDTAAQSPQADHYRLAECVDLLSARVLSARVEILAKELDLSRTLTPEAQHILEQIDGCLVREREMLREIVIHNRDPRKLRDCGRLLARLETLGWTPACLPTTTVAPSPPPAAVPASPAPVSQIPIFAKRPQSLR